MRHWAEEVALRHLESLGYRVEGQNVSYPGGEIDILMWDGPELVMIGVRQRRGSAYGSAAESIDRRKLQRIQLAARHYLARKFPREQPPVRFDAVLVTGSRTAHEVEHLQAII